MLAEIYLSIKVISAFAFFLLVINPILVIVYIRYSKLIIIYFSLYFVSDLLNLKMTCNPGMARIVPMAIKEIGMYIVYETSMYIYFVILARNCNPNNDSHKALTLGSAFFLWFNLVLIAGLQVILFRKIRLSKFYIIIILIVIVIKMS